MAYCTVEDLVNRIGEEDAALFSNNLDPTTVDVTVIQGYIDSVADTMDAYLRDRYTLPITEDGTVLKEINLKVAIKEMMEGQRDGELPDKVIKGAEGALKLLRDLGRGLSVIKLVGSDTNSTANKPMGFYVDSPPQQFTKKMYDQMP